MAETKAGKKIVKVAQYTKIVGGKKVKVPAGTRSTPRTSKGKQ